MDLLSMLEKLSSIERWNLVPHTSTWSEAESIALTSFIAYGICASMEMAPIDRTNILKTILLYRLKVSYLSDISYNTLLEIKKIVDCGFMDLEREINAQVFSVFPDSIKDKFLKYIDINYYNNEQYRIIIDFSSHIEAFYEICPNFDVYIDRKIFSDDNGEFFKTDEALFFGYLKEEFKSHLSVREFSALLSIFSNQQFKQYFKQAHNLKYLKRWNSVLRRNQTSVLTHSFMVAMLTLFFVTQENIPSEKEQKYLDRALFHDFPESFTGDIISPVKEILNKRIANLSGLVEKNMISNFLEKVDPHIKDTLKENGLLLEFFEDEEMKEVDALVKECDKLALIFECVYEIRSGLIIKEIETAYKGALRYLEKSEHQSVKDFVEKIKSSFPPIDR